MTEERKSDLLDKALDWLAEHFEGEDLHNVLTEHLEMSDDEINEMGFDLMAMYPSLN